MSKWFLFTSSSPFFPFQAQETTWTRQVTDFCLECDCWLREPGYFQMQVQYDNVNRDKRSMLYFVPFEFS